MSLIRFIKGLQEITDTYEESIKCTKDLQQVLDFVRKYCAKGEKCTGRIYHGNFQVLKDLDRGTWHEIQKAVVTTKVVNPAIQNYLEEYTFRIQYYRNVVHQIDVRAKTYCAKEAMKDFKKDFSQIPDVKAEAVEEVKVEKIEVDFSSMTILEVLDMFDKEVKKFGDTADSGTFENVKHIRAELDKKLEELPIAQKAKYMQGCSKVDVFLSTLTTQFANPVMRMQIKSVAANYVAQMRAEIAQMMTIE